MKILILGGTHFIGRHIVQTLLAAGHNVSILTRGVSPDELPATVERLRGDRDDGASGLNVLSGRTWDVCIDVSGYTPRQVRASAEKIYGKATRYVYVSAVSVYGDPTQRPVLESHPLVPPAAEDVIDVNGETYGALKVACENIVQEIYAERATILRPQIVVGPYDQSGRYSHWVQRALQGDQMLAPGDGTDHVQFIDVRDLARFTATVIEHNLAGSFNLAGHRLTWAEFMIVLGAGNIAWVSAAVIAEAGLTLVELPLYRPERGARSSLMDVSNKRARHAGLTLTDPAATVCDMQVWMRGRDFAPALSPEREKALISIARERRHSNRP